MGEKTIKAATQSGVSTTSTMMVQITTDKCGPKLVCPICNKALVSLNGYVKHMKKHEPPGGFCCCYCDDRFCLEELLKKHKDEKHKVLACQICHATFSTAQEYRAHIKDIHKGVDRPMSICEKCGMEFKTPQAAKRHVETQCGQIKPHPCDECEMAFYTKYNLAEHKKIHSGEKKFCCSYCGKSFLSNGRLVIHERSHTGEKPYKCDVCGKCFAHRESIVTHSSIHTGVKLVVCKCCGARFSCHSNLIKHRRTRQDTCGLAIYDATKQTKRSRTSRIPASLMSSEIKIVRASKVINPTEEQKKPRVPKTTKPKQTKLDSDNDEVIIKRPRRSQRSKKLIEPAVDIEQEAPKNESESDDNCDDPPFECPLVDIDKDPSKNNSESDDNCDDPPFECPLVENDSESDDPPFESLTDPDDSSDSSKVDVKPPDRFLTNTPVKIEEEQVPINTNITIEKDNLLPETSIEIKDEPVPEVKEEKPDIYQTDLSSIKPCRVILEEVNPKYRKLQASQSVEGNSKSKLRRNRSAIRTKLRLFKKERTYNCEFCVKVYHIRKPYENHLREQHNKTDEDLRIMFKEEENDIPAELVHRCPICSKVYLMIKRLKTHITYHGPDGSLIYKCPCYCKLHFRTKEEAMEHAKIKHKAAIYCNVCEKYSQTPESLRIHKRTHEFGRRERVDRNLICDKCAKSFASRTALSDHTRSNCGQNPLYHCDLCGKNFSTAGILKTHSLLHKDETPFVCDKCGKAFKIQSQYKTHIKHKHSDDKPFKCELCPKQYPYRESLLTHMAIHTGLKRYVCNGCSKRFTCISNLQAHRKVYADTCGLQPLNSKPSQYIGVQKGSLLMGTKPSF